MGKGKDTDLQCLVDELRANGYGVIPPGQYLSDIEPAFMLLWNQVKPYTMISVERAYSLYSSVLHIVQTGIRGDFVECGVWKGGAAMLMALALKQAGVGDRSICLFDTFMGMTEPSELDRVAWNRRPVRDKWEEDLRGEKNNFQWWAVSRDTVWKNMISTGYPAGSINLVEGDVMETLPSKAPEHIALLRLDTDWYESTRHELEQLFPRLRAGGILLIDDYGHFTGARKAVDEYFAGSPVFLHRDDYTGRSAVKQPVLSGIPNQSLMGRM